jgi:hypothetical protein
MTYKHRLHEQLTISLEKGRSQQLADVIKEANVTKASVEKLLGEIESR